MSPLDLHREFGPRPPLCVDKTWHRVFEGACRQTLAERLGEFVRGQRWYRSKGCTIEQTSIDDVILFEWRDASFAWVKLSMTLCGAATQCYAVVLCYLAGASAERFTACSPNALVSWLAVRDGAQSDTGALVEGMSQPSFGAALLHLLRDRRPLIGESGRLEPVLFAEAGARLPAPDVPTTAIGFEQSNSSIVHARQLITKCIRLLEVGESVEVEMSTMLTHAKPRCSIAPLVGAIHYRCSSECSTWAITSTFIENQGTAWDFVLRSIGALVECCCAVLDSRAPMDPSTSPEALWVHADVREPLMILGGFMRRLGVRTAEMHLALGSEARDSQFVPESFTLHYRQALCQRIERQFKDVLEFLKQRAPLLDETASLIHAEIATRGDLVDERLKSSLVEDFDTLRIRCHGDYHLGQLLFTGDDFVIIDFDGEPARPLGERRSKQSPLVDLAGMTRSFDYAVTVSLKGRQTLPLERNWPFDVGVCLKERLRGDFLESYTEAMGDSPLRPRSPDAFDRLLRLFELEKCLYEIVYEFNNRPDWVTIPLSGLARLLGAGHQMKPSMWR